MGMIVLTASFLLPEADAASWPQTGAYWISATAGLALIGWFIRHNEGASLVDYLGLHPVPGLVVVKWLFGISIFYGIFVMLPAAIATQTGFSVPAPKPALPFFISIVMVAPILEEVIFRGFMMAGLLHSRAKVAGTIFLTTVIWTAAHLRNQVDWVSDLHGLGIIFCFGTILAVARIRSNSLILPLILHSSWNAMVIIVDALIIALKPN
jgi:membrane protease YdiL (CAAX protease family)